MTDTRRSDSSTEAAKGPPSASTPPHSGNPAAAQPGEGSEPREGERLGRPTSQGLSGAQGSGGGADRGIQQAPTRPNHPAAAHDGGVPGAPPSGGPRSSEGRNR